MSKLHKPPPLPPGTKPLSNQVAGHKYGDGKMGCLEVDDGTILKHVQCPPKGQRELDFYNEVFMGDSTDDILLELQPLVPRFHGVIHGEKNGSMAKHQFLKLENLMTKLSKPCIVDIKMGRKTYDPEASPEKVALEIAKFPPVMQLGYQFSGMLKFDIDKNKMVKYDKYFCKSLTEKSMIVDGLGEFFLQGKHHRKDCIQLVIDKLKRIEKWFLKQKKYAFYASSLLIVYDASVHGKGENNDQDILLCSDSEDERSNKLEDVKNDNPSEGPNIDDTSSLSDCGNQSKSYVDVRMIDFTHVFTSNEEDENYIFGLQNLIKHLESLMEM